MINEKIVKLTPVDILPHSRAIGINFQTSLFHFHAMGEQQEELIADNFHIDPVKNERVEKNHFYSCNYVPMHYLS